MAQRSGDPRRITLAHAMFEDALGVHRASQLAGDRAHRDLEAVLGSLVRVKNAYRIVAARQLRGGGSTPVTAPAATPDPTPRPGSRRLTAPGSGPCGVRFGGSGTFSRAMHPARGRRDRRRCPPIA